MRRTPLKRYTRLRPIGKTAHARRPRDFDYMGKVAKLPCIVGVFQGSSSPCEGRIEINHVGGRYGKDTDRNTVPMCSRHHKDWTGRVGGGGFFAGWHPAMRRNWGVVAISVTRATIAAMGAK